LKRRLSNPSHEGLNRRAKSVRRSETFNKCQDIHGGTKENQDPTTWGMIDTLNSKCKADVLAVKLLNSKTSLKRAITNRCLQQDNNQFKNSKENLFRSLSVYYAHSVMRKYNNVRKANAMKGRANFVPYKTLSEFVKVDIGKVYDIDPTLTQNVPRAEIGEGSYRDLVEYGPRLAEFYLTVNENRVDKLHEFSHIERKDPGSFIFLVAIGGDEAPLAGTTFLVSFLNVGRRIASSQENFLVFGANVKENGLVQNYLKKLVSDLKNLESEIFHVNVHGAEIKVEFKVESVPNDMKMLAFLAGELSNASFYFCTFANVNQKDLSNHKKTFSSDGDTDWKPFTYSKRLQDAKLVATKKKELQRKKLKPATLRNKITTYIKELNSRQEEVPLLEKYSKK